MTPIGIGVIGLAAALAIFGWFVVRYMDKQIRKVKQSRQRILTELLKRFLEGK